MSKTQTQAPATVDPLLERLEQELAPSWIPEAEGDTIVGVFLRLEQGPTQFGPKPFAVLATDEGERSVWIFTESMMTGFRRAKPEPGERVAVRYMGMKPVKNQTPGRRSEYHDYRVVVDRPVGAEKPVDWDTALAGNVPLEPAEQTGNGSGSQTDEIPF